MLTFKTVTNKLFLVTTKLRSTYNLTMLGDTNTGHTHTRARAHAHRTSRRHTDQEMCLEFQGSFHVPSVPGSSVDIATGYELDSPGIETPWGRDFSAPIQTGPGAHPASCTMGTGSPPMGRTACTEPQCLYKGALYLFICQWYT
jgi:hypothetical protein